MDFKNTNGASPEKPLNYFESIFPRPSDVLYEDNEILKEKYQEKINSRQY